MAGGGHGVLSLCLWGVINIMNRMVISGRGGLVFITNPE